ncbi:hypothetical protein PINS_up007676 [Pythium insidiosum]|nr:hypothetical protein PINS_up007676 [Pythium insidiosum]
MQDPSTIDTQIHDSSSVESFVLRVGHRWFQVLWFSFAALHSYCALHLIVMGLLYRYIDQPYMLYFANLIAPEGDHSFTSSGVAFAIVGGLHLAFLLEMSVLSVAARQFVLSSDGLPAQTREALSRRLSSRLSSTSSTNTSVASKTGRCNRCKQLWVRLSVKLDAVFGRRGLLGVEGSLFDLVFVVRESVQIAVLTFQAYQTSARSTNVWLNQLFVTLVIAHCWSAPVLQLLLHRRPALQRVLCIAMDLVFTAGTNMVIPVLILKPYYDAFLPEYYSFDLALFYNETWFANLVMELRLLFSTTAINFLSKIVTHLSILLCVVSLKSLLARDGVTTSSYVKPDGSIASTAPNNPSNRVREVDAPGKNSSLSSLKSKLGSLTTEERASAHERLEDTSDACRVRRVGGRDPGRALRRHVQDTARLSWLSPAHQSVVHSARRLRRARVQLQPSEGRRVTE